MNNFQGCKVNKKNDSNDRKGWKSAKNIFSQEKKSFMKIWKLKILLFESFFMTIFKKNLFPDFQIIILLHPKGWENCSQYKFSV